MLNRETLSILLLLIAGASLLAWLLHWVIGISQRRWVRWLAVPDRTSLRRLLIDWISNGLRTVVWTSCLLFIIKLIPQTRDDFRDAEERLRAWRIGWGDWVLTQGIELLVTIVVTIFLMRFASALIRTVFELFEYRAVSRGETTAKRRSQTLSNIFRGIAQSVIFFIGLMKVLQQLGTDVTPILASAGVVGIAVGFGAQSLIKDLFAGFLILLEDQYNVGDTIKIGDTTGTVERMMLRATQIRALDGSLTTIPNGSITTVANLSKDWARVVLDLEVDYQEDADRAAQIMLATAQTLREERPGEMIEDPVSMGVERITPSSLVLRLTVKTLPQKQAEIARELRRRIKLAFDQAGVRAPVREQFILTESNAPQRKNPA
jgi:moderate conductance mechanosensitive channel